MKKAAALGQILVVTVSSLHAMECENKGILLHCFDSVCRLFYDPNAALDDAVRRGSFEAVVASLRRGADVNGVHDSLGYTALHTAVMRNQYQIVDYLLTNGAEVQPSTAQLNPLHYAALSGDLEITKLLVAHGADVNASGGGGNRPLHVALRESRVALVRFLLEKGAHPDVRNNVGKTPLLLAAQYGMRGLFNLLVAHGADPEQRVVYKTVFISARELLDLCLEGPYDTDGNDAEIEDELDAAE